VTKASKIGNEKVPDLIGKTFAFFGEFSYWPSYHPCAPEHIVLEHGAIVQDEVDDNLDFLVLGDLKGTGRSEAKKKAESLKSQAEKASKKGLTLRYPEVIDEKRFRELFRLDLSGLSFAFFGGFDCCGGELDEKLLKSMVESVGAVVRQSVDHELDYFVLGNRKGDGKIAAYNKAKKLQSENGKLRILDEKRFLDLVRTDRIHHESNGGMDFPTFLSRLHGTVDDGKLGRAMKMLKTESFKLYSRIHDGTLVGVVRSQSSSGTVYASWLTQEGTYGCAKPDLEDCMGLQGSICKHLLVLLVALARAGEIECNLAYSWVDKARGKRPRADADLVANTFLQYKGAEAGEIDWRPTQTIPEDFYAY